MFQDKYRDLKWSPERTRSDRAGDTPLAKTDANRRTPVSCRRRFIALGRSFLAALLATGIAQADVWDEQSQSDDGPATANELVHGSDQVHDLGALPGPFPDEDWFRLSIKPYSSYEVVVDGTSGDIGPTLQVDRVTSDGTIFGSATAIGLGFSRSMRFHNPNPFVVEDKWVRVRSGVCTTSCTPSDVYRLRFYETTGAIARFNDTGGQVTVLVLQNPTSGAVTGTAYFWDTAGVLLAAPGFTLGAKATLVLDTTTVPGAGGQSGSLTVGHDARYGDLSGKTVALAPAQGWSFDSPMLSRPR